MATPRIRELSLERLREHPKAELDPAYCDVIRDRWERWQERSA